MSNPLVSGRVETEKERKARSAEYHKAYYREHSEERKAYNKTYYKAYYQEHSEELKAYNKAHYKAYYQEHSEERKAYSKAYYKANAEKRKAYRKANAEESKAYNKAYREAHLEESKAYSKAYKKANAEERKAYRKAWRREHPEECRTITMKRRARKRGAPGTSTTTAIQLRRELYGNKCWICGETPGAIDHIKPLAKGGSNWPANLRPICKSCNSSKHASWPVDTKPNFTLIYSARGAGA